MGKKTTTTTKPATPAKRAAKTKPAAEKLTVEKPATPAPVAEKVTVAKPATAEKPATAKAKAPASASRLAVKKPKKPTYSQEDVALRAYFIAERRQAAGLAGDSHQDWIEAERQLASEASTVAKPKAKKA